MEPTQTEVPEQTLNSSTGRDDPPAVIASSVSPAASAIAPQQCPTCQTAMAANGGSAATPPNYIYAIGRIEARFPAISVEKEFAQATGRSDTKGQPDRQVLQNVLSKPENRYLVRQLCFVLTIEGLETYILVPRDPADISLLVDALRPTPQPWDLDVVIGVQGPMAPPTMCNGLIVPIVVFDQIYSFDRDALIKAIPRPDKTSAKEFAPAAEELFDRIMQMADNAGATDENRALNYLAMRYQAIYANAADAFGRNCSLTGVDVEPSALSGTRNVKDVILTYTNRTTDVDEQYRVRVDVTDEFPFLVSKLAPYFGG
jgi:FlaG/FlaF family flagellin (archaellin)